MSIRITDRVVLTTLTKEDIRDGLELGMEGEVIDIWSCGKDNLYHVLWDTPDFRPEGPLHRVMSSDVFDWQIAKKYL